jgi:copper(I)-binding protein
MNKQYERTKIMTIKKCFLIGFCALGLNVAITYACPPITTGNITIVGHRWIRPSTGPNTAAYLTITNTDDQPDRLVTVKSEHADMVELHNNIEEDGVMKMRPVAAIEIGKDPVELKPGGLHIMLMGLRNSFQGKDSIPLTLVFEKAGPVTLNFSVKEPEKSQS